MSDHALFLDAIRSAPDDDAPRLIYADWLEESHDPLAAARAELIRVQCQRAAAPAGSPLQIELEARENQLLRAPGRDWDEPLRALLPAVEYHRGFVERIACSAATFLRHGESIRAATPLRRLTILDAHNGLAELLASPALAGLESLDLSFHTFSADDLLAIVDAPRLRGLQELGLEFHDAAGETSLAGLAAWDGLRALRLSGMRFRGGLGDLARATWLSGLKELSLKLVDVDVEDLATLLQSPRLTGLRALDLSAPLLPLARRLDEARMGGEVVAPFIDALAESTQLVSLDRLTLKRSGVPPASLRLLLEAPHLRGLRSLNLSGNGRWNNLRTDGTAELVGAAHWTRLQELNLSRNGLQPIELRSLTESRSLGRLTSLDLGHNLLGDVGARLLAASPLTGRLVRLSLSGNRIRGDGCTALADSPYVTQLRSLDLSDNPLGPAGAAALSKSRGLKQLAVLRLEKTGLNDRAVPALTRGASLEGLMTLDLSANPGLAPDHFAALVDHFGPEVCVVPS